MQRTAVGVERTGGLVGKGVKLGRSQGVGVLGHRQNFSGTSFRADLVQEAVVGSKHGSQQDGMRL